MFKWKLNFRFNKILQTCNKRHQYILNATYFHVAHKTITSQAKAENVLLLKDENNCPKSLN